MYLTRDDIVALAPCRKCGARRGAACRSGGKTRKASHHERMHLAQLWAVACDRAGEDPFAAAGSALERSKPP